MAPLDVAIRRARRYLTEAAETRAHAYQRSDDDPDRTSADLAGLAQAGALIALVELALGVAEGLADEDRAERIRYATPRPTPADERPVATRDGWAPNPRSRFASRG